MQVRARSVVWTSLVVASSLALLACRPSTNAAREAFGKTYSCPDDRITVTAHPELTWDALVKTTTLAPPAEIAADPGRLAKWQADHAPVALHYDIFEVTGCDEHQFYGCKNNVVTRANDTNTEYGCTQAPASPATTGGSQLQR